MMMIFRLLVRLLVVVVLGWGALLLLGGRGSESDFLAGHNPCLDALSWRVGEVDSRFGISREVFAEAVRSAVRVWEEPTGLTLFRHDPEGAMPVHLLFDDRQAEFLADEDRRAELGGLERELDRLQTAYDRARSSFEEAAAAHRRFAEGVDRRVLAHNAVVAEWNRRGGAPEEEHRRLLEEAAAIARDQDELRQRAQTLEARRDGVAADGRRLEQAASRYNTRLDELRAESPGRLVNSATFQIEIVTRATGRSEVRRWINVFQFSTPEHLVFVLAHELGHALGLEHVADEDAIMREEHAMDQLTGTVRLQPSDRQLLTERCEAAERVE